MRSSKNRFACLLVSLSILSLVSVSVAKPEDASVVSKATSAIPYFSTFGDGLFRGGRPTAAAFQELKNLGIKTVVDLQGGDIGNSTFGWIADFMEPGEAPSWIAFEKNKVESMGMTFLNLPINSLDDVNAKTGYGIGQMLAFMNDPKNQPVFIHCEHGIDRTGLLVALYRVLYQGWTRADAHDEMVEMGHGMLRQIFTGEMDDFFWAATQGRP